MLAPNQILRPKLITFDFGWSSAPDLARERTSSPEPIAEFKGAYFKGEKRERKWAWKERGRGEEEEGRGGDELRAGCWGLDSREH